MTSPSGRTGSFRDAVRPPELSATFELPTGHELRDGWLTQFGIETFRTQPRFDTEFDVSVLKGKLTLTETTNAVVGRKPKPNANYRHRHFSVPRLVAACYRCLHTPSRRNPQHASILAECPDEDVEAHRAWWSDPRRETLDSLAESGV